MSCVNEVNNKLQEMSTFFGKIDDKLYKIYIYDVDDVTTFNDKVNKLLSNFSYKESQTHKLYATGESKLEESKTLYYLAQCTRDLSGPVCKKCLDDAIRELPNCCDGKQGGRVVGGSCYVRYELYPIIDA
ncbi:cysteine-rich repeat secretory protein 38-like [Gastrolobium bilobum]|uniref:cysteine-rich repeat secretory protein 38-like n=1 Tax=Gastrolobium bilobum TaxID=150636 RepID=UPI002AB12A8C|nr:cysteine-rich repeat secretory protein 38-like [Gastrolobium bilobum]